MESEEGVEAVLEVVLLTDEDADEQLFEFSVEDLKFYVCVDFTSDDGTLSYEIFHSPHYEEDYLGIMHEVVNAWIAQVTESMDPS